MGILADFLAIALGGLFGGLFRSKLSIKGNVIFGIGVMLISAVGIIENIFNVTDKRLESSDLLLIVGALILGFLLGEALHIENRISRVAKSDSTRMSAFLDATIFFGIGGLQICGPILLAVEGDSSQLYLKAMIDLPFALMYGAMYGKWVVLSALPVAAVQALIAVAAYFAGPFVSDAMLAQLCAVGYIILFFSGFNLLCERERRIHNINMLPAVLVIILYNLAVGLWG